MYRAFVRDLQQLDALRIIERAAQGADAQEAVDLAAALFAVGAIGSVNLVVLHFGASGRSSRVASSAPCEPGNSIFCAGMAILDWAGSAR